MPLTDLSWLKAKPFAHRGLHTDEFPENSLAAIRNAIQQGYPVEIDVQVTTDGIPVVFHDWTLDRLTGQPGVVSENPFATLERLRLCSTEEKIPRLEEVLELLGDHTAILIEIKNRGAAGNREAAISKVLQKHTGTFAIQSFNPRTLIWFRKHCKDVPRGQLSCRFETDPMAEWKKWILANYGTNLLTRPHFLGHQWERLPALAPSFLRNVLKIPIIAWTVRSESEQKMARRWTDNIIFEGFLPTL
jgi:glycerophosphoryl diester phosphodiesterase